MLKVINGKIYVEEVETTDAELIGMAFKDFAEKLNEYRGEWSSEDERVNN